MQKQSKMFFCSEEGWLFGAYNKPKGSRNGQAQGEAIMSWLIPKTIKEWEVFWVSSAIIGGLSRTMAVVKTIS